MVKLGTDLLEKHSTLFENKRIGLVTNPTGINKNFESTVDLLHRHFNLVKLFAPEHGVRGNLQAGITLEGYTDDKTSLPVISLYGENRRPSKDVMQDIDLIAFDIQDVGSRFYTYMYTMAYVMEACANADKEFIVFDRPNPLGAIEVEGNMLDVSCKSFIGLYPMPQRYGLTIGECALLFNEDIKCNLKVVKMEGYRRNMYFEDTGLNWILPSPNIPTPDSCFTFNCSCIFEGTNVSEGRGTTKPFSFVGAPWIDGDKLADKLNNLSLPGVYFRPHYFTPMRYHPTLSKYVDELCGGVEIHVLDRHAFKPIKTGITMLYTIRDMYKNIFSFTAPYKEGGRHMIDYNTGNTYIREEKYKLAEVLEIYDMESKEFRKKHSKPLYA